MTVYEEDGSAKKFFVSSGSVSINEDASVQILAEEVHKVEDLDGAAARDIVAKAQAKVSSAADEVSTKQKKTIHPHSTTFNLQNFQVARAEAQIELEVGEALVAACV